MQHCWLLQVHSNCGSCKPGCYGLCLCLNCLSDLSFIAAIAVWLVLLIWQRVELGFLRCVVGLICLNLIIVPFVPFVLLVCLEFVVFLLLQLLQDFVQLLRWSTIKLPRNYFQLLMLFWAIKRFQFPRYSQHDLESSYLILEQLCKCSIQPFALVLESFWAHIGTPFTPSFQLIFLLRR